MLIAARAVDTRYHHLRHAPSCCLRKPEGISYGLFATWNRHPAWHRFARHNRFLATRRHFQVTPAMARTFLHDTPQSVVRGNAKPVRLQAAENATHRLCVEKGDFRHYHRWHSRQGVPAKVAFPAPHLIKRDASATGHPAAPAATSQLSAHRCRRDQFPYSAPAGDRQ